MRALLPLLLALGLPGCILGVGPDESQPHQLVVHNGSGGALRLDLRLTADDGTLVYGGTHELAQGASATVEMNRTNGKPVTAHATYTIDGGEPREASETFALGRGGWRIDLGVGKDGAFYLSTLHGD